MKVLALDETERTAVTMDGAARVTVQRPIVSKDGTPSFSLRVFTIEPGGHTPFHTHDWEHLNYVIDGEGVLRTDAGERPVRKGDFALVLPGEKHQYRNTSSQTDLVMICGVPKQHE
jgi:quercetin dioxygenase-like cupin family protein